MLVNCAMLTPNLCISPFSSLSFLFSAPFLLFKLWCLILPARISAPPSPAANSGSASARLSREFSVVDFLLRPPRLSGFLETRADVVDATRETKDECLMVRLSRLEERKESLVEAFSRNVFWGARGWMELVMRAWRRAVADGFWGAWPLKLVEIVGRYRGCFTILTVSDVVVWREAGGDDLEDGYKKFWWGRFLRSVKSWSGVFDRRCGWGKFLPELA